MNAREASPVRGTVVIVEDNAALRQIFGHVIAERLPACHVETVSSSEEALTLLRRLSVDVVVTDLMMPGLSGLDLAAIIRRDFAHIRMILITAFGSDRTSRQSLELGFFDFLEKPFKVDELIDTIKAALSDRDNLTPILSRYVESSLCRALLQLGKSFPSIEAAVAAQDFRGEPVVVAASDALRRTIEDYGPPQDIATWSAIGLPAARLLEALQCQRTERIKGWVPPANWPYRTAIQCPFCTDDDQRATLLVFPDLPSFRLTRRRVIRLTRSTAFLAARLGSLGYLARLHGVRTWNSPAARAKVVPRAEIHQAFSPSRSDLKEFGKMIAGMTHDLRSGLGLIRTYGELALQASDGTEERDAIRNINQALRYSELILGNLSDLVFRSQPKRREHDLNSIIRDTLSVLEPQIPAGVKVELALSSDPVFVVGDEGQLKRILMNLIQNATQAMPDGGTVSIETRLLIPEHSRVEVCIRDTGMGIPAAQTAKIFELSYSTKREGYGLGLFIVKRLLDANDGTIEVQTELNRGTTFRIELPILKHTTLESIL